MRGGDDAEGGDDPEGGDRAPPSPQKTALKWALEAEAVAMDTPEAIAVDTPKNDLPSGAATPTLTELQPPLVRLRRTLRSSESCAFGSIRFPGRSMPAKYVWLAPDSRVDVLVSLLVDTWKLDPPCAVLALNPSATRTADDPPMSPRLELILRRGIAEAARQTHAWVFTCGERGSFGAQAAGYAQAYGYNIGYESPFIAVVAGDRMIEDMSAVHNGKVHHYGSGSGLLPPGAKRVPSFPRASQARAAAKAADGQTKHELDSRHTHFIMVDGGLEGADGLRDRLEYYISSQVRVRVRIRVRVRVKVTVRFRVRVRVRVRGSRLGLGGQG